MKKIFYILLIGLSMMFNSCYIQQEVEIHRSKKKKTEYFEHKNRTVKVSPFSNERKMRTRHRYIHKNEYGTHFIPKKDRRDFIHYTRTGKVRGTKGKVREIKRGTVAVPKRSK